MNVNGIHPGSAKPRTAVAVISAATAAAAGLMFIGTPAHARQISGPPSPVGHSAVAPSHLDPDHDGDTDVVTDCARPRPGHASCLSMKVTDTDTYVGPRPEAGGPGTPRVQPGSPAARLQPAVGSWLGPHGRDRGRLRRPERGV